MLRGCALALFPVLLVAQAVRADEDRTELAALPLIGGDSDLGFGGGALVSLTRVEAGWAPYRWRAEIGAVFTFKRPANDGWQMPYQDAYVLYDVPNLIRDRLRLELRPSYTSEQNQSYYGIGNAAPAPDYEPDADYFQYARLHPTLSLRLLFTLGRGFFLQLGNLLTYNEIGVHPGSKLAMDLRSSSAHVRSFFGPTGPHLVDFFEYTLYYDTRDNEVSTSSGMYHQLRLRLSPGGVEPFPYRYGQANATARFYATPIRRWLTLGVRVVGDVLFGHPPFYELARYDDTFALGGVRGVRGVPGARYYGKIKLFGNVESRSQLASFRLFALDCTLAGVLFMDLGRLWSDWQADPLLDGHGAGLKLGIGAGLRLQQGTAFVVRADLAWSPDARPIGAYVTAGQIF
jgi:outer membrane protein assembly factor BamA